MAAERIYYEKEIWDSDSENQSLSKTIQETLLSIGIPPNIYGYAYITYAVELLLKDSEYQHYVTKGLYVDIAQKYRTTPSRVERAIRHAISVAWLHGNADLIHHIFRNCVRPDKGVPSNSVFLARLYYYIKNYLSMAG
ncbi:MAG: sporulation initiation factor Spo0A C-terminal domain-containing protein [Lachnospiraceae bacterium]|nr:sporulation initiation factor Spo0A C-terminal domain-containing protein [Lachnospiraceae bacterium]